MDTFAAGLTLVVFFACSGALALAWLVYPVLRTIQGRSLRGTSYPLPPETLGVAAVLATRDEPRDVARKIRNLRELQDAPRIRAITVGIDPLGPWPVEAYREALSREGFGEPAGPTSGEAPEGPALSVVQGGRPGGKATTLNAAVEASPQADFILIVDTAQTLEAGAISAMVAAVHGEGWGGATGVVRPESQGFLGRSWQILELGIRSGQAATNGLVTTSGAISMLRWDAWIPLPAGTICDDLFLSMGVAKAGGKIGYCADAVAVDPRIIPPKLGFEKKVRTLTGLWQFILNLEAQALNPARNPLFVDFLFHKIMRLLTPVLALFAAVSAVSFGILTGYLRIEPVLLGIGFFCIILAFALLSSRSLRWRVLTLFTPFVATRNALRRDWNVWVRTQEPGERPKG